MSSANAPCFPRRRPLCRCCLLVHSQVELFSRTDGTKGAASALMLSWDDEWAVGATQSLIIDVALSSNNNSQSQFFAPTGHRPPATPREYNYVATPRTPSRTTTISTNIRRLETENYEARGEDINILKHNYQRHSALLFHSAARRRTTQPPVATERRHFDL